MLQHVWERATQARYLAEVLIATDDERIREAAARFGARVVMTRADHPSGTDRVAEAASASKAELVVNLQGDEPLIEPAAIDAAALALAHEDRPEVVMSTLAKTIQRPEEIADPNVVKVVADRRGLALYFSRAPIPYFPAGGERAGPGAAYLKHIGLYVYRRAFLLEFPALSRGPLEQAERLEQLRALEHGYQVAVHVTEYDSIGVDSPEDYRRVVELFEKTMVAG
jgi:3-deoxy-manno-octulosonate cytidylyltransferase (CMP-KDO synthetase)